MSNCISKTLKFPALKNRKIEASFDGGSITSDAGILLLRQVEQKTQFLNHISKVITDNRDKSKIDHTVLSMLTQRVLGIALGYEDLNDHIELRNDIAFQTGVNKDSVLASSSTLCRFENSITRKITFDIHKEMVNQFINSQTTIPKELILDFDATDDLVYGNQEGRSFNSYYGDYCFLPLYVFCGKQLLVSYLRPSNKDGALHAWAIFSLLVRRFRESWPNVKIIFRGDSGFCRHKMFDWCEKKSVGYITGTARNSRLEKLLKPTLEKAENTFNQTKEKQRIFTEFNYRAGTWSKERRVIGKAEHTAKGRNPRFIVTNLKGDAQHLYDNIYCARGEMENRIKEKQLDLFADRTSCHNWWSNQFRLILSSLAYILVEYLQQTALVGTELKNALIGTIRLKLFKIGAVIVKNTRRIMFHLSSHCPYQKVFEQAVGIMSSA